MFYLMVSEQNKYGVGRMNIRPVLKDEKIIKVENKKEQKKKLAKKFKN